MMMTWAEKMEARGYEKARQEMTTWAEELEARGYEKARQEMESWGRKREAEGRKEGEAALLIRQITRRYGPLSPEIEQTVESAGSDQLLEWGDRFVTARSLEEIFDGKP